MLKRKAVKLVDYELQLTLGGQDGGDDLHHIGMLGRSHRLVRDETPMRMTYVIPKQDDQTEHLFGERTYYGQVVSLLYKGEVVDVQAWPRDLAARIQQKPAAAPGEQMLPEFQNTLPADFDPNLPLLPPLPTQ